MLQHSSSTCIRAVYISKLILYSRACSEDDFLDWGLLLTRKLLNQRVLYVGLKSSLRNLSGRHHDLEFQCHKWPWIRLLSSQYFPVLTGLLARVTVVATSKAWTLHPSGATDFSRFLFGVLVAQSLVFCVWRRVWRYQREVIRICISKKNGQHNDQKKKYNRTNND